MSKTLIVDTLHPHSDPTRLVDVEIMSRSGGVYARGGMGNGAAQFRTGLNIASSVVLGTGNYRQTHTTPFLDPAVGNSRFAVGEYQVWNMGCITVNVTTVQFEFQTGNVTPSQYQNYGVSLARMDWLA